MTTIDGWRNTQDDSGSAPVNLSLTSPKRYELIRQLRRQSEPGFRALARTLHRDVKRVHEDVVALEELGLVRRDSETGVLSTDIDSVSSTIQFAA
jgi:predicted transcriptional regulator